MILDPQIRALLAEARHLIAKGGGDGEEAD
jgi:hypothetical protein